jgi:hypothetical protein
MPEPNLPPSWNKIAFLEAIMTQCAENEWLLWLDADVLILDYSRSLESLVHEPNEMLFSTDIEGLCMGFFLMRNTARVRAFLACLWQNYTGKWPWEQAAAKKALEADPSFAKSVGFISERIVQNPRSIFEPNAFAMHYWANHCGAEAVMHKMKVTLTKNS